jgi:hypothetical protein
MHMANMNLVKKYSTAVGTSLFMANMFLLKVVYAQSSDTTCDANGRVSSSTNPAVHVGDSCISVNPNDIGFRIPTIAEIFTFVIRGVFVIGGLLALYYLLTGAISYITSGGDKEKTGAAQAKIQAAIVGVILIAVVLAVIVTLEQVIFSRRICLGISCPLTIPSLIKAPTSTY